MGGLSNDSFARAPNFTCMALSYSRNNGRNKLAPDIAESIAGGGDDGHHDCRASWDGEVRDRVRAGYGECRKWGTVIDMKAAAKLDFEGNHVDICLARKFSRITT